MLTGPAAVEEAALAKDGFLPALSKGSIWVDCSTVNPSFSARMAAAKEIFVAATEAGRGEEDFSALFDAIR
jgi:3-hydroxyisobutyrate dehydrogenase-like beta-hydroxyacid dehydrogenase